MKYKAGDKVVIKTWKAMKAEFGLNSGGDSILCQFVFTGRMEEDLKELKTNRVLTIKDVDDNFHCASYRMEEIVWNWSDEMIKRKAYISKKKQKEEAKDGLIYKDMMGRTIKVGDHVLHLWCRVTYHGQAEGGPSMIKHKLATVIKLNPKSIRIRYRKKRETKEGNITNTTNRIIVMENDELRINPEDIVEETMKEQDAYRKSMNTKLKNARADIKIFQKKVDLLQLEKKDLENTIKELTKGSDRFKLLDLT